MRVLRYFPLKCNYSVLVWLTQRHLLYAFVLILLPEIYPVAKWLLIKSIYGSFSNCMTENILRWWMVMFSYVVNGQHTFCYSLWRHQMETFSALLTICAGNSPVAGEFPAQRPVTRSVDVFFDLRVNKRLSKQSWGWWYETLSRPIWRQCNVVILYRAWSMCFVVEKYMLSRLYLCLYDFYIGRSYLPSMILCLRL